MNHKLVYQCHLRYMLEKWHFSWKYKLSGGLTLPTSTCGQTNEDFSHAHLYKEWTLSPTPNPSRDHHITHIYPKLPQRIWIASVSSYHSPKHTQTSTPASFDSTHFSLSWYTHTLAPPTHLNMFASRCVWYFPTYIHTLTHPPIHPPPVPDTHNVPLAHPLHPPPTSSPRYSLAHPLYPPPTSSPRYLQCP